MTETVVIVIAIVVIILIVVEVVEVVFMISLDLIPVPRDFEPTDMANTIPKHLFGPLQGLAESIDAAPGLQADAAEATPRGHGAACPAC